MAKLIAKIQHTDKIANILVCEGNTKDSYLVKFEYLDANGKVEATGVKWHAISKTDLYDMLYRNYGLVHSQVDAILGVQPEVVDTLAYLFGN